MRSIATFHTNKAFKTWVSLFMLTRQNFDPVCSKISKRLTLFCDHLVLKFCALAGGRVNCISETRLRSYPLGEVIPILKWRECSSEILKRIAEKVSRPFSWVPLEVVLPLRGTYSKATHQLTQTVFFSSIPEAVTWKLLLWGPFEAEDAKRYQICFLTPRGTSSTPSFLCWVLPARRSLYSQKAKVSLYAFAILVLTNWIAYWSLI